MSSMYHPAVENNENQLLFASNHLMHAKSATNHVLSLGMPIDHPHAGDYVLFAHAHAQVQLGNVCTIVLPRSLIFHTWVNFLMIFFCYCLYESAALFTYFLFMYIVGGAESHKLVFSTTMSDDDFLAFLRQEGLKDIDSHVLPGMHVYCIAGNFLIWRIGDFAETHQI